MLWQIFPIISFVKPLQWPSGDVWDVSVLASTHFYSSVREQMFGTELVLPLSLCHEIHVNVHEKQGRALGFH